MARSRLAYYMGQSYNFIPDILRYIEKFDLTKTMNFVLRFLVMAKSE